MASLVLAGNSSGTITISAPAVAGSNTLTLQAGTGIVSMNTLATAVASTSGTSIDFTGLPSWIKRITVMFAGVSTNGTSVPQIQLGTGSTTYTVTGYLGAAYSTTVATTAFNTGALINPNNAAANVYHGSVIITNITGNTWVFQGAFGRSDSANANFMGGQIPLAAVLTAVRITTVNGTDAFDAGSINILYEG